MAEGQQVMPQIVPHYGQYGGMDQGSEPHLLGEKQWRTLHNMQINSGLRQVPRKRTVLGVGVDGNVDAIVNLPNGRRDYGLWLMITRLGLWNFFDYDVGVVSKTLIQTLNNCDERIVAHVYNGRVFFTNRENRVRYFDSNGVHELFEHRRCWTKATDDPDILGNGPFQRETLYVGETPVGDLGKIFTWTTDSNYRVYVQKPNFFVRFATVEIKLVLSDTTTKVLTGRIVSLDGSSIVVKASNTVTAVLNDVDDPPAWVKTTWMPIPHGRYVTTFFDHVVVASPTYKGRAMYDKVIWSHLYDFAQWEPGTASEADSYTFTEHQRADDLISGVTGIAHFGELLLISTPSCIYAMSYTGLPRVVRVAPIIKDFGCGLPYAMAELNNAIMWCDVHHQSFFVYRGQGPEDVGQPIATYFFADLTTLSEKAAETYCYVDRTKSEVVWVYRSIAYDAVPDEEHFDKAIAYNYVNNAWSVRDGSDVTCFGHLNKRATPIDELVGLINAQTGTIDQLENSNERLAIVWGGFGGALKRDEETSDPTLFVGTLPTVPVLETGDLIYGSAQVVKEVSAMTINATAKTFNGLQVEVSAREHFDDPVTFTVVGTWTTTLANKQLTFKPICGKILRYRFIPFSQIRDFVFRGYEDNVVSAGAHR